MNFEHLKSFIKVVETGSFSTAATLRFLSQPTISNQIKALEKEVGSPLLLRHSQDVSMTPQGESLYRYAKMMVALEEEALNEIHKDEQDNDYHLIRIAAPGLMTDERFHDFFNRVLEEGDPDVLYSVIARDESTIPGSVASGEMALGISNITPQHNKLVYEHIFTEEIYLITPNQPKYRDLDPTQLRELLLTEGHIRYDFGNGPDYLWNDFFGKAIGEDLHDIKSVGYCSNYRIIINAVAAGYGIAFISSTIMQHPWREGKILAYRCRELLEKPFYLVYDSERMRSSKRFQHARDLLMEELGSGLKIPDHSF